MITIYVQPQVELECYYLTNLPVEILLQVPSVNDKSSIAGLVRILGSPNFAEIEIYKEL